VKLSFKKTVLDKDFLATHVSFFEVTYTHTHILLLCLLTLMFLLDVHNFLIHACALFRERPFGWLHSIMLTATYSIISYGNIFFDFHVFGLLPFFQEYNYGTYSGTFCMP